MSSNNTTVNVTIDKKLIKLIDIGIKEKRFKSRSHALEYCAYIVLKKKGD